MNEPLTGATADAMRALADRCVPGRIYCREGAELADMVDETIAVWLSNENASRLPSAAVQLALTDLKTHIRRCAP